MAESAKATELCIFSGKMRMHEAAMAEASRWT
jgi:hypothetical protein